MNDHEVLSKLRSGLIQIDVLSQNCTFNGKAVEKLKIAQEIGKWFHDELSTHHIPSSLIFKASLSVQFHTEPLVGPRRATEIWAQVNDKTTYTSCCIHCESLVSTDERTYSSKLDDYEEWPDQWWLKHPSLNQSGNS